MIFVAESYIDQMLFYAPLESRASKAMEEFAERKSRTRELHSEELFDAESGSWRCRGLLVSEYLSTNGMSIVLKAYEFELWWHVWCLSKNKNYDVTFFRYLIRAEYLEKQ